MLDDQDVFEIIGTTRAMRRLTTEPVADALIHRILQAGAAGPNASNTQRWRFLVIKDPAIKQAVQIWYRKAYDEVMGPRYAQSPPPPGVSATAYARQSSSVQYLTEHFHEAPVWIVACQQEPPGHVGGRADGASIYPAVQNMLLAARALGLGATLTTRHLLYKAETEAAMGLPPDVHSYAILPIGHPMGRFGPVRRGDLDDVVFLDHWGEPYR